jgi:hypothetical protein
MTPKVSTNNYESTPRAPLMATTNNTFDQKNKQLSKLRVPRVQVSVILKLNPLFNHIK